MKISGVYFLAFIIGSTLYPIIETVTRGYTHWSMMVTGGTAFLLFCIIYIRMQNKSIFIKSFAGMLTVVGLELTVGLIVNKIFNMNVWDYSGMKYNFLGQISLAFSACWYLLSFISFCIFNILDYFIYQMKLAIQEHHGLALEQ